MNQGSAWTNSCRTGNITLSNRIHRPMAFEKRKCAFHESVSALGILPAEDGETLPTRRWRHLGGGTVRLVRGSMSRCQSFGRAGRLLKIAMKTRVVTLGSLVVLSLATRAVHAVEVIETDICVYGGTSAGVAAAVQTTRMGKRVVLAE